ncbi:hypothetical protein [Amycolatopsis sp. WGS_07]|uniref:hypothetical protein n=1 Tax=Amycolatopsis sp. WGS_07 TaxID=3076764 RepID=UPI003873C7F1
MVAVLADEPFVQQLLTLTAVLLGAAASSHRAVGQRTAQRYRIAATRRGALPVALEEGLAALADAENERAIKWETVLLLGSKQ